MLQLTKIIAAALFISTSAFGESADSILEKADQIRVPKESFLMKVRVENSEGDTSRFQIKMGGKNKSLIKTLSPKREIGKNFLMLHEEMWAYIPNIRRSLRVALNQKMTGQFANGDMSRMRWHGQYDAKLLSENKNEWQLMLKANKKGLTYEAIRLTVDKKTYRPLKADYLTKAGKALKHIEFGLYRQIAGDVRPTKLTIRDAENNKSYSHLTVETMKMTNYPDSVFSKQRLR